MIPERISAEDLCVYAMGLLNQSSSAQVEEFLAESTEARTELERVRGDLALLAFTAEPVAPPPALRQRILREIARESKPLPPETLPVKTPAVQDTPVASMGTEDTWTQDSYTPSSDRVSLPSEEETTSTKGAGARALFWTGWLLAAGMAVAFAFVGYRLHVLRGSLAAADAKTTRAAQDLKRETANAADAEAVWDLLHSGSAQHVLLKGQATKATAQISYVPGRGALVLQAFNTEPVPAGKAYELWLTRQQPDGSPIPAGLFQPDDHGYAMLAAASTAQSASAHGFAVTVEDVGGSTVPTLPFMLTKQQ